MKKSSVPYRGIIVPIITPLADWDTLDQLGLSRLVEHLIRGGIHGIFVLGTSGEGPSLSRRLQYEMVEQTCKLVGGRVPVLVGVTNTSAIETIELAMFAAKVGADVAVLSTPYYFPADQSELLWYCQQVIPKLPLPTFLYNIPQCTKIEFAPETVRQLIALPNVIGFKDSAGDVEYFKKIVDIITKEREDLSVFIGPDAMLGKFLSLGGHGGVSGGANLAPELFVRLYEASVADDEAQVDHLQRQIWKIEETIYSVDPNGVSFIKGVKCALSCLGVCEDHLAAPFSRLNGNGRIKVQEYIEQFGLKANLPAADDRVEAVRS